MRTTLKKLSFLACLIFSFNVAAATNEPMSCPSLAAIKAEGLMGAEVIYENPLTFAAYSFGQYGTEDLWQFALGPFLSASESEALEQGHAVLNKMSSEGEEVVLNGFRLCKYETGEDYIEAFAYKTEIGSNQQNIKALFKR